jgi:threonine dehydratase
MLNFDDIEKAWKRIKGIAIQTPVIHSHFFSQISGNDVYFKLENLQRTGSFKVRGAANKLKVLKQKRKEEVIAASAGNHAQGVAFSAKVLGMKATIVMPKNATKEKILATKSYGGKIILYGKNLEQAIKKAVEISKQNNIEFIHPYDDELIIAGQGTIGLELADKSFDYVFVPVGGGGLISGMAIALKEQTDTKIIGVECKPFASMAISLKKGEITKVKPRKIIADGIAVPEIGKIPFEICKEYVDGVYAIDEKYFKKAIFLLLQRSKLVVEGAGAAGVAFLLSKEFKKLKIKNRRICIVISGGNINKDVLKRLL